MKKKLMKLCTFIAVATMAISCGTANQATNQTTTTSAHPNEQHLANDPCEDYALENPSKRAAGMGLHFQKSTAKNQAELEARAALAKSLQTCIETNIKNYADAATLYSADNQNGQSVTDQTASLNDRAAGMSKELVTGAPVVKISTYMTQNNQYRVYVCVEYSESVSEMAEKIAKRYNEMLTDEQKARINFNELEFQKTQEEAFNNYKGVSMQ